MINDKMFRAMCVFPDAWVYGYLAKNLEINFYLLREENEQEKESRLRKESNREAAKKEERRLEYLVLKKEFGE